MKSIVVIGASGLVGSAFVRELAGRGHSVVAVGRNEAALSALTAGLPTVQMVVGDVGTEASAAALRVNLQRVAPQVDAVVTSINPPRQPMRITEVPTAAFLTFLEGTLLAHLNAAKTLAPIVAEGGAYVGIGGASSDFVWPENGHISINQAAQRMLYRVLALELQALPIQIREYVIAAMVHDGTGTQGVSSAAVAADFAQKLFEPNAPAVSRFPAPSASR